MKGRTHGKDIMLLCKGWHDEEKYKTTKDALTAYYNKNYRYPDNEVETLSYDFINKILLKPTITELLTERFKYSFIICMFDTDGFDVWKIEKMEIKELSYEEELYYRLTKFIRSLRHYENDGTVLIDTSDYWLKENGSEVIVDGCRTLVEPII